jgi:hypothetical protein
MISFGAWKKPFSVCRFQNNRIGRHEKIRTKSGSDSMFLAPQVGLEPTTLRLTEKEIQQFCKINRDDLAVYFL